jgi:hypothetical protein
MFLSLPNKRDRKRGKKENQKEPWLIGPKSSGYLDNVSNDYGLCWLSGDK